MKGRKIKEREENIGAISLIALMIVTMIILNSFANESTKRLERTYHGYDYAQTMEMLYAETNQNNIDK